MKEVSYSPTPQGDLQVVVPPTSDAAPVEQYWSVLRPVLLHGATYSASPGDQYCSEQQAIVLRVARVGGAEDAFSTEASPSMALSWRYRRKYLPIGIALREEMS